MIALIRDPGFFFIDIFFRPQHPQIVIQRRTAFGTAFLIAPFQNVHNFLDGLQLHPPDFSDNFVPSKRCTAADAFFDRYHIISGI
ncbi:hypothetical protein D3C85_1459750 [compost metagenome]